jgi:predicted amidohydrolase YtcJ
MASSRVQETMMRAIASALLVVVVAFFCGRIASAQTPADVLLHNGKIVTVDDRFTIAEALAIRGERIVAVGSNAEIDKHRGPSTRVVDLNRRTVIPGLIDNHAHYMRAAEYWHREVRLDGITSHREALDLMNEKAAGSKPGEWVVVLGGWSEEQFVDEPRGFSRTELDAIAPRPAAAFTASASTCIAVRSMCAWRIQRRSLESLSVHPRRSLLRG